MPSLGSLPFTHKILDWQCFQYIEQKWLREFCMSQFVQLLVPEWFPFGIVFSERLKLSQFSALVRKLNWLQVKQLTCFSKFLFVRYFPLICIRISYIYVAPNFNKYLFTILGIVFFWTIKIVPLQCVRNNWLQVDCTFVRCSLLTCIILSSAK